RVTRLIVLLAQFLEWDQLAADVDAVGCLGGELFPRLFAPVRVAGAAEGQGRQEQRQRWLFVAAGALQEALKPQGRHARLAAIQIPAREQVGGFETRRRERVALRDPGQKRRVSLFLSFTQELPGERAIGGFIELAALCRKVAEQAPRLGPETRP